MIRCKDMGCPEGKDICCRICEEFDVCSSIECSCTDFPHNCEMSVIDGENGLALFESNALAIMRNIVELDKQKKAIEAQDAAIRQELQKAMDKYGVTSFENDILKITHVAPTTRTSIDSARLKKELPAVAEKYSKVSNVKGFVKIEVK